MEILLVLVIFASAALVVVMTIPSDNKQIQRAELMKSLMEYASERASLEGRPIGLSLTAKEYKFVSLGGSLPLIPDASNLEWLDIPAARMPMTGEFEMGETVMLSPGSLNKSLSHSPQIIFMPDGTLTAFELGFSSSSAEPMCCTIVSEGRIPLIFTLRGSERE